MRDWLRERGFGALDLFLWGVGACAWVLIVFAERLQPALPNWSAVCGARPYGESGILPDVAPSAAGAAPMAAALPTVAMMILAMTTPTLAGPLRHLWDRSLSRHRWRAIALFAIGYFATWMAAYVLLAAVAFAMEALSGSRAAAASAAALASAAWQASLARARCLARCHLRPRLSVFGLAALADPLLYGVTLSGWCVATCWALMVLALCGGDAHLPLMAAASLLIVVERHARPRPARTKRFVPLPAFRRLRAAASVAERRIVSFDRPRSIGD